MNSTFPRTGTWLSRWHALYTEVHVPTPPLNHDEPPALPRTSQFTTAA